MFNFMSMKTEPGVSPNFEVSASSLLETLRPTHRLKEHTLKGARKRHLSLQKEYLELQEILDKNYVTYDKSYASYEDAVKRLSKYHTVYSPIQYLSDDPVDMSKHDTEASKTSRENRMKLLWNDIVRLRISDPTAPPPISCPEASSQSEELIINNPKDIVLDRATIPADPSWCDSNFPSRIISSRSEKVRAVLPLSKDKSDAQTQQDKLRMQKALDQSINLHPLHAAHTFQLLLLQLRDEESGSSSSHQFQNPTPQPYTYPPPPHLSSLSVASSHPSMQQNSRHRAPLHSSYTPTSYHSFSVPPTSSHYGIQPAPQPSSASMPYHAAASGGVASYSSLANASRGPPHFGGPSSGQVSSSQNLYGRYQ